MASVYLIHMMIDKIIFEDLMKLSKNKMSRNDAS